MAKFSMGFTVLYTRPWKHHYNAKASLANLVTHQALYVESSFVFCSNVLACFCFFMRENNDHLSGRGQVGQKDCNKHF